MSPDEFQEINEFSESTQIIGQKYFTTLKSTFKTIEATQTQMILEGQTRRLGIGEETTIAQEFWSYYTAFSSENLPDPAKYYGDAAAELKIMILIRQFQMQYLERIYPTSFPVPIIQKSYRVSKSGASISAKFFIVGDLHGSFRDISKLIRHFDEEIIKGKQNGYDVRIIFIGDYIDRGALDLHTLLYAMAFNLRYPKNVLMLRGNHEEISIAAHYGFGKRVMEGFSQMLFASFVNLFKDLPLMCIFNGDNGSFMCLHGGIPLTVDQSSGEFIVPHLITYQFDNRQIWINDMDPISQQILWNDPISFGEEEPKENFFDNRRGIGYTGSAKKLNEFCLVNKIHLVFRGHQVFSEGFHKVFDDRFITIFSASEYVGKKIHSRFVELNSTDIFNFVIHAIQDLPG